MIRDWHVNGNHWSDIGYHYVIEGDGSIKEGRPVTRAGAHVKGNNKYTIGVCLTGNFEIDQPSRQQLDSLWSLIEGLLDNFGLTRRKVLAHHEDVNAETKCCGENLYHYLVEWRKRG
jgi:N-acetyl-anhydromuramyl-L-alanine amidase AmpD|tara:strand:+ start:66 stop:416 length:351 start_codon:yes stop_codon:yes gene_type:complete